MDSNRPEIPGVGHQCTGYVYPINTLDAISLQVENETGETRASENRDAGR